MKLDKSIQRPPAEQLFSDELDQLGKWDPGPTPSGWKLSPLAIERFILGDDALKIQRKFVAPRELVTRVIIALVTNRGAMLVGVPGTAKSWLSELLSCAISGQSTLTVQGGSVTHINQLLYSWNEALLHHKGPCYEALIPGPILSGMKAGKIVRFEEIARCAPEIQDGILSILSERQILIPELGEENGILFARNGFNIIATSNTLDQGIYQMSAALKRRMTFETIQPIKEIDDEIDVVIREASRLINLSGVSLQLDNDIVQTLVTIFHELRNGQTLDGRSTDRLAAAVMSTAEAVSVIHALGVYACYYRDGKMLAEDLIHFLIGASIKDNPEDRRRLKHYFETEIANKTGRTWSTLYSYKKLI